MRGVIVRFLKMEVLNEGPVIYWALVIVWLILLVAAFSSVRNQSIAAGAKAFWMAFILLVPIVGLAAYAIWCLLRADWSFLKPLMQTKSQAVKSVSQARD